MENFDIFDFVINDEDEIMLLLYVQEGEPANSYIEVNKDTNSAVLFRNAEHSIDLKEISEDILDAMFDAESLLVCELSREEDDKETKIIYAYEAEVRY